MIFSHLFNQVQGAVSNIFDKLWQLQPDSQPLGRWWWFQVLLSHRGVGWPGRDKKQPWTCTFQDTVNKKTSRVVVSMSWRLPPLLFCEVAGCQLIVGWWFHAGALLSYPRIMTHRTNINYQPFSEVAQKYHYSLKNTYAYTYSKECHNFESQGKWCHVDSPWLWPQSTQLEAWMVSVCLPATSAIKGDARPCWYNDYWTSS